MDGFTWFAPTAVAGVATAPTIQIVNGYSQTMTTQTAEAELQRLTLGAATQNQNVQTEQPIPAPVNTTMLQKT